MESLADNVRTVIGELQRSKPPAAKGTYWKNVTLTTTMGPGIRLDIQGELLRL